MTYLALHVTSRALDLNSNFGIDLLRSTCIYFDASQQEKHGGSQMMSLDLLVPKLFAKNILSKRYFDLSWPLKPNLLKFGQFWRHLSKRAVKQPSNAFSEKIGSEIMTHFWINMAFRFLYLRWPLLTSMLNSHQNDWCINYCSLNSGSLLLKANAVCACPYVA